MCLRRRILMMNRTLDEHSMFEILDAPQLELKRPAKVVMKDPYETWTNSSLSTTLFKSIPTLPRIQARK
jgi:hypothetical protein